MQKLGAITKRTTDQQRHELNLLLLETTLRPSLRMETATRFANIFIHLVLHFRLTITIGQCVLPSGSSSPLQTGSATALFTSFFIWTSEKGFKHEYLFIISPCLLHLPKQETFQVMKKSRRGSESLL